MIKPRSIRVAAKAAPASDRTFKSRCPGLLSFFSILFPVLTAAPLSAGNIVSNQTGPWSVGTTWVGGTPPTGGDSVTIMSGHVVTVDDTSAVGSTTTIYGKLAFSTAASSRLDVAAGSVTVASGGTFEMGTDAAPIPAAMSATLLLGQLPGAAQSGLSVRAGAAFTVRGATKTPAAVAVGNALINALTIDVPAASAVGWAAGDVITIGKTRNSAANETERRTIDFISGADPLTLNWTGGLSNNHYSTSTLIVANLTRNAVIRSSGTSTTHISVATSGFNVNYAELEQLGPNNAVLLTFSAGSNGATLRNSSLYGYRGLGGGLSVNSNTVLISSNIVYAFAGTYGVYTSGTNNILSDNYLHSIAYSYALYVSGTGNRLLDNKIYSNATAIWDSANRSIYRGNRICSNSNSAYLYWASGDNQTLFSSNTICNNFSSVFQYKPPNIFTYNTVFDNTFMGNPNWDINNQTIQGNKIYSNGTYGIYHHGNNVIIAENEISSHTSYGIYFYGNDVTFLKNSVYLNTNGVNNNSTATNWVLAEENIGYDAQGVSKPNTTSQFSFGSNCTVTARGSRFNSPLSISTATINAAGRSMLSYRHNAVNGEVRLWGAYTLSNKSLDLEHSGQLYISTWTSPKLMRGSGHSAVIHSVNDANALTEVIDVTYLTADSSWHVRGSSSGELGTFSGSISSQPFPSGTPKFYMTFTPSTLNDEDRVDFALLAASADSGIQKKLLFGRVAPALNSGRSSLTVGTAGKLKILGTAASYALVDMIAGDTFYSLISTGTGSMFTVQYSSFNNFDAGGLQFYGSSQIDIASVTLDNIGVTAGTGAYITAGSGLVSPTGDFNSVRFNLSTSTSPFTRAYNVYVLPNDGAVDWAFYTAAGAFSGPAYEYDPNNRVLWTGSAAAPKHPRVSALYLSSITLSWAGVAPPGGYIVDASTAGDFTGTVSSSKTLDSSLLSLTAGDLDFNTTYYLRAGAMLGASTDYTQTLESATLAKTPDAPLIYDVQYTSVTLNWSARPPAPQTESCSGYIAEASTAANFTGTRYSSSTYDFQLSTLIISGLSANATYYFRVGSLNVRSSPNYVTIGATTTPSDIITSVASGNWSDTFVWDTGMVPGTALANRVTISTDHVVTMNVSPTVSTLTIFGTLKWGVASSTLSISGGDLSVERNGTLELGTEASPLPPGTRAVIILATGPALGAYGLIVRSGANFVVRGSTRSPYTTATSPVLTVSNIFTVDASSITGWAVGDVITIGMTKKWAGTDETERRIISDISGDQITVSVNPSYDHYATSGPILVANLTRNAVILSSGTQTNYIRNLAQNATSFAVNYGEFVGLGTAVSPKYGIVFDGASVKGGINNSSIYDGYSGFYSNGALSGLTLTGNLFYNLRDGVSGGARGFAVYLSGTGHTFTNNHIYSFSNTTQAMAIGIGSTYTNFSGNFLYSNSQYVVYSQGSYNTMSGNDLHSNGGIALYANEGGAGYQTVSNNRTYNNVGAGIYFNGGSGILVSSNTSFNNTSQGMYYYWNGSSNTVRDNNFYANGTGLTISGNAGTTLKFSVFSNTITLNTAGISCSNLSYSVFTGNVISSNTGNGAVIAGGNNTFRDNTVYANGGYGLQMGDADIIGNNDIYGQTGANGHGVYSTADPTLVGNYIYSNSQTGVYLTSGSVADCGLGYDRAGAARPNTAAQIGKPAAGTTVVRNSKFSGSHISTVTLNAAGRAIISYRHDQTAGLVRLWGDYVVAGSTLTLDYAAGLYGAFSTPVKLMRGTGHSGSVVSIVDAAVVSQIISVTSQTSNGMWNVVGSSSGLMDTFSGNVSNRPIPPGTPQFYLTLTQGGAPQNGDSLDFALIRGSNDAAVQKKLQFGSVAAGFNSGRSRLGINSSGGVKFAGAASDPTLIDWIDPGNTYYTLISSGAFTVARATFTNFDAGGLQFSGSPAINMVYTTLDNIGATAALGTYIRALGGLVSDMTFSGIRFDATRSLAPFTNSYNVYIAPVDTGINWSFCGSDGAFSGTGFDYDPNSRVNWTGAGLGVPQWSTLVSDAGFTINKRANLYFFVPPNGCSRTDFKLDVADDAGFTVNLNSFQYSLNPAGWSAVPVQGGSTVTYTPQADLAATDKFLYMRVDGSEIGSWSGWSPTRRIRVNGSWAWTDAPVLPRQTPIRRTHITELRSVIENARQFRGLSLPAWTDPVLDAGSIARAVHTTELRSSIAAVLDTLGSLYAWTDPTLSPGATFIRAAHVNELRAFSAEPATPTGQQTYTTPGSYSWIAPAGVTSVSVVAVGGGGGVVGGGGGGGALRYGNNITVIPGNSYTVIVGSAGISGGVCSGAFSGGDSSFNGTVIAGGGSASSAGGVGSGGDGGGNGGNGGSSGCGGASGGGGAGGYSGNGGNGGVSGGGDGGGGGGVGLFGQGANGAGGFGSTQNGTNGAGGGGGGGGGGGSSCSNAGGGGSGGNTASCRNGGSYGGGAGVYGAATAGGGAVRIIWPGTSRRFPSTNVGP